MLIAVVGCEPSPAKRHYDDSLDGFRHLAIDLVDAAQRGDRGTVRAMAARFALPDPQAWFTATFGEPAGARLLAEYQASRSNGWRLARCNEPQAPPP